MRAVLAAEPAPAEAAKISWRERLFKGLAKTRAQWGGKLKSIFSRGKVDDELLEELETLLLTSDVGIEATTHLLAELVKANNLAATPDQIKAHVDELAASYEKPADVVRWYYSDNQRMAEVEAIVIESNVTEFVLSKAKVTDKSVAFDELMGQGN